MEANKITIADNFFGMIKNLNAEVKLELMDKISDSLKEEDKVAHDHSWKKLFGTWVSDESAEEMIDEIRASRHTNRQLEDL